MPTRRRFLVSAAVSAAALACRSPLAPVRPPRKYLALGDSVTERRAAVVPYPDLIAYALTADGLEESYDSAVGGYTTALLLAHWDERVTAVCPDPDLVTVMLGVNDHWIVDGAPRVSLDQFDTNVRTITARLHDLASAPTVIVLSATYIAKASVTRLQSYNATAARVAADCGCAVVDCFTPLADLAPDYATLRWTENADGVHPNSAAQRRLATAITPEIRRAIHGR